MKVHDGHKWLVFVSLIVICQLVYSHEMTPTYPKWSSSHIENISKTTMEMFNKRQDVEWYEIGIFDKDWKSIPFVTSYKIIKVEYLGHVNVEVFINDQDKKRAVYICSKSKIRKEDLVRTAISSRICSKFTD